MQERLQESEDWIVHSNDPEHPVTSSVQPHFLLGTYENPSISYSIWIYSTIFYIVEVISVVVGRSVKVCWESASLHLGRRKTNRWRGSSIIKWRNPCVSWCFMQSLSLQPWKACFFTTFSTEYLMTEFSNSWESEAALKQERELKFALETARQQPLADLIRIFVEITFSLFCAC